MTEVAQELSNVIRETERKIFNEATDVIQGALNDLHKSTGLIINNINIDLNHFDHIGCKSRDYIVSNVRIDVSLPRTRF